MTQMTLDEVMGAPPAGKMLAQPPSGKTMTLDEVTGANEVQRQLDERNRPWNKAKDVATDVAGYAAGTVGQISDMFTSIIGGLARLPTFVGTNTTALWLTNDRKLSAQAAKIGAEEVLPEEVTTPWRKVAEASGQLKYYEQNGVGFINEWISKAISAAGTKSEKVSGVPSEYVEQGIDSLMTLLGVKGTKTSFLKALEQRRNTPKPAAENAPAQPDTSVPYETGKAKLPLAEQKAVLDAKIKEGTKVEKTVSKHLKESARFQSMAEKLPNEDPLKATLQERADVSRGLAQEAREADLNARAAAEAEAKAAKTADLEERVGGSTYAPKAADVPDVTPGEMHRIMMKPGHERTATDLIKLRALARQDGKIDMDLVTKISVGAAAGTLLWKLYQTWEYEQAVKGMQKELDDEYERGEKGRRPPKMNPPGPYNEKNYTAKLWDMSPEEIGGLSTAAVMFMGKPKQPGGMWHPEAVERLARPLGDKLIKRSREQIAAVVADQPVKYSKDVLAEVAADKAALSWSDSRIRTYLNRYAGTERDPLKDVEIPFGAGTKRWEEVTDSVIAGRTQGRFHESAGAKEGETVWTVQKGYNAAEVEVMTGREKAYTALESYLSHLGDFLRQNVAPEKLGQMDLVRAVKEERAHDAKMVKEMEKAAAASMKDMPVYKDYGDGFKWVELKLAEKLTEEQARGINKTTDADIQAEQAAGIRHAGLASDYLYRAVDAQGRPIKNSYTGDIASASTPERAHLAGQLSQEGNQMGHCVGGYCEGVASGESRIFSLRDSKGKSHVTVEVAPAAVPKKRYFDPANPDAVINSGPQEHPDILQIKGKQNRAPAAEYLPYVQDFVKGGKWGEVGDWQNTGLFRHDRKYLARPEAEALVAENYKAKRGIDPEIKSWDAHALQNWLNDVPKGQRGSADPRLLASIAAVGGIAAYAALHPEQTENLAALGLLALPVKGIKSFRDGLAAVAKGLDYTLGATSTRLGNISPALRLRSREYERRVLESTENSLNEVQPFLQVLAATKEGSALDMALLRNEGGEIAAALKGQPAAQAAWKTTQGLLKSFEDVHKELGRFKEGLSNYFPRIVTDLNGLKKALGQAQRTSLEEALVKAEAKMIKEQQRGLTDVETSLIVNRSLQAGAQGAQLPGFAKERGVKDLTETLRPFYAPPTDSLLRYVSAAIQDAEMARFFGKDLASRKVGGKLATDVDASIGNIVAKELKAGRMTHEQANELRGLLKSRFEAGERATSPLLQDLRNSTNITLLGQFGSAATQIGDSVMTIYHHGMLPTLEALRQKLTGSSQVTTKEFGLVNHIAEELGSNRWTGKALQAVFKANGFSLIDRFAKGLNLNAGLAKNQRLAQTDKGRATLAERYAVAFGDEFPALLQDLRSRQVTPRVKSLLFNELSDAQPITKAEMPQAYLDHPNGRLLYQMKTYMLKQMDVIRRDAYNEIKSGHYVRGAKNLVAIGSALALSSIPGNVIKDWISGRDVELDKIDYMQALLQNFAVNRYTLDQMDKKPLEVGRDMVLPPYKHYQELFNAAKPGASDKDESKAIKYAPLAGRAYYDRELGGNEARKNAEMTRLKQMLREDREAANPALKAYRLQKEEQRKRLQGTTRSFK